MSYEYQSGPTVDTVCAKRRRAAAVVVLDPNRFEVRPLQLPIQQELAAGGAARILLVCFVVFGMMASVSRRTCAKWLEQMTHLSTAGRGLPLFAPKQSCQVERAINRTDPSFRRMNPCFCSTCWIQAGNLFFSPQTRCLKVN